MRKEFNKLVRDKMIDIYKHDVANKLTSLDYKVHYCDKKEILELLKEKLLEEVKELIDVYEGEPAKLKEEIADVIEVMDAMLYHNDMTLDEALSIRAKKKDARGGFETGLYLEYIDYL